MDLLRTDPELLARFRRGEREAFERVYWAYVDHVVRRGFQMLRESGVVHVEGVQRDDVAGGELPSGDLEALDASPGWATRSAANETPTQSLLNAYRRSGGVK